MRNSDMYSQSRDIPDGYYSNSKNTDGIRSSVPNMVKLLEHTWTILQYGWHGHHAYNSDTMWTSDQTGLTAFENLSNEIINSIG